VFYYEMKFTDSGSSYSKGLTKKFSIEYQCKVCRQSKIYFRLLSLPWWATSLSRAGPPKLSYETTIKVVLVQT